MFDQLYPFLHSHDTHVGTLYYYPDALVGPAKFEPLTASNT